jgi:hypothetical protein
MGRQRRFESHKSVMNAHFVSSSKMFAQRSATFFNVSMLGFKRLEQCIRSAQRNTRLG